MVNWLWPKSRVVIQVISVVGKNEVKLVGPTRNTF